MAPTFPYRLDKDDFFSSSTTYSLTFHYPETPQDILGFILSKDKYLFSFKEDTNWHNTRDLLSISNQTSAGLLKKIMHFLLHIAFRAQCWAELKLALSGVWTELK